MVQYGSTTSTVSSGTSVTTWNYWITAGTTTTTTATSSVWHIWTTCGTTPILSEKELLEAQRVIAAQEREAAARQEQERAVHAEREKKARLLLKELLTEQQNKQLDDNGFFELTTVNSGNRYRVWRERSRNIELLDKEGKRVNRLCFHPKDYVHDYDTMAAQKLMLEYDEEEVKKVANYS